MCMVPPLPRAGPGRAAQHLAEDLDQGDSLADLVVYTPIRCHQTIVGPQARRKPAAIASWPRDGQ